MDNCITYKLFNRFYILDKTYDNKFIKKEEVVMEDWLRKCLDCYHYYINKNDDSEVCCKRADKGKDCRFYSEKEHNNRIKKKNSNN